MSGAKRNLVRQDRSSFSFGQKDTLAKAGLKQNHFSFARKESQPSLGNSTKKPIETVFRHSHRSTSKKSQDIFHSPRQAKDSFSVYQLYTAGSKDIDSEVLRPFKGVTPLSSHVSLAELHKHDIHSVSSGINKAPDSFRGFNTSEFSANDDAIDGVDHTQKYKGSEDFVGLETSTRKACDTKQMYSKMFEQAVIGRATRKSYRNPKSIGKKTIKPQPSGFSQLAAQKEIQKQPPPGKNSNKIGVQQDDKLVLKKRESDITTKKAKGQDKNRREPSSPLTTTVYFESPQKSGTELKITKKQVSSKGTTSSASQATSIKKTLKHRSKSIYNWNDIQDPHLDGTPITKHLRRGETLEIDRLKQEDDKESKQDDKLDSKTKPKLRKTQSSNDVVARSTHAIILGKYGKLQSK